MAHVFKAAMDELKLWENTVETEQHLLCQVASGKWHNGTEVVGVVVVLAHRQTSHASTHCMENAQ